VDPKATRALGPPVRLADYRPPAWLVDSVTLTIALDFDETSVHAVLAVRRNPAGPPGPLVLDGAGLVTDGVWLDGRRLDSGAHALDERTLTIPIASAHALVETRVRIRPDANTALEGLYRSGQFLVTQCEAQGFRHITWFPDRPDVMSRYTVTLVADRERFPVLLSNGNPEAAGLSEHNGHWARWNDPHPKPSYLFALVAGRLDHIEDRYVTAEGRAVVLRIWAERDAIARCHHAMECVVRAMRWDEQRFGRSYDLDVFNIVATHDFNMGAMENKGLNIFNAKYIVADAISATDEDFLHVEGVVAHEYFHNWTGNRVTCRDWFQLSLKEGLTVYRDQEFSADTNSRALKRIDDVRMLRSQQFTEDAGAFAHPVRPESYHEINNFYTATVYEKGAEIVRMLATMLGPEGFRRGMDLYFARHDGEAVTCDDFRRALADANAVDLSDWARWYSQAGTPRLRADAAYDAAGQRYVLDFAQHTPPTPGQADKHPLPIPVRMALYGGDGTPLPLRLEGEAGTGPAQRVLLVTQAAQRFVFTGVGSAPVPSLLQDYSAPVELLREVDPAELAFLARHDRDAFNRWDAIQRLMQAAIAAALDGADALATAPAFAALVAAHAALLGDAGADPAWVAECLSLPDESYLAERLGQGDPQRLHDAREALRRSLGAALGPALATRHEQPVSGDLAHARGCRRLRDMCLGLLVAADPARHSARARAQFAGAATMTERLGALTVLVHGGVEGGQALAEDFYRVFRGDPLVVDKWLLLQASNPQPGTLERVQRLTSHAAFTWRNPNKVRALVGAFARANRTGFHAPDGAGYRFIAESVRALDTLNPQIAARLVTAFNGWRHLEPARQDLMRRQLEDLAAAPALSPDVAEIVARALL